MDKHAPYICPNCADEEYRITGYDFDATEEDGEVYEYVIKHCHCTTCGAHFDEYYRLDYDGYYYNSVIYNKYGARQAVAIPLN
jgi:hypothetical protein